MSEGEIGRILNNRYRLSRSLGRGGMGEVWLAVDTALGREVAVKELLLPKSLDAGSQRSWLERSKREAIAAARIRHENVVTVHDVFEEDGLPWIVMELVISRSLADVIRAEGRLDHAEAARIGLDVLRALRAAHAKGVLHRDVKPANVLLGTDGRVVLTDFGIATFADAPQVTQFGELLGTPGYLAPERAEQFSRGRAGVLTDNGSSEHTLADVPGALDPASDLWSLGATLYEMVEGLAPFRRSSPVEVVDAVVNAPPAPPRHAGPLEPVIMGLLRKDPLRRLDAKETDALLTRVVQDSVPVTWGGDPLPRRERDEPDEDVEATYAGEGPPQEPISRPAARARWWRRTRIALPAALAFLLVAVGASWLAVENNRAEGGTHAPDPLANLRKNSPTYREMVARGRIIIGVKPDQPGWSVRTGDQAYQGFDDDVARMIADDLGFKDRITFMDVETQNREYRITSGQVDLVVASYTINAARSQKVSFAGPYFIAGQDFLVRSDEPDVNGPEDLADSAVCVVRESTSATRIRTEFPTMKVQERGKYSECVDELLAKKVRGVSTDDAILSGFVAQYPGTLRILGRPFSDEPYGVGLSKGDVALADAVCGALNRHIANGDWQRAYDVRLRPLGLPQPRAPQCRVAE
ncbi:bifunctional serine/threonine-protein kinase/glutamate ABC transporter substrate-binding protein [Embleya scabrispora]|uniref:bifunctional serine/threonine-protein kinase/glutamate ABC transporter substrate-binding protein n=1 Tax=Embleya scabrispora TaxID=159449 RepID=UPI0003A13B08|nr:bifunctional serine/threonine-protein kinase/glutamate ABC transporter substrate-binding protein [Embleya scabrispora]MYS80414.1 transporter substrate-binding domain-containing protein [Streptomyces sp. SID5474]